MRVRFLTFLAVIAVGGCSLLFGEQKYSVYFEPYSSKLDQQAMVTLRAVSQYAHEHEKARVLIAGFSAPADPSKDIDGLSAQRADVVMRALVADGINEDRLSTQANGITDPEMKPNVAVRRVDITFAGK